MTSASIFVDTLIKNQTYSKTAYLACCGLIIQNNQIFVSQRQPFQSYPGLWEFPGGKIEANETLYDSLTRELHEEIDIKIENAEPILSLIISEHQKVSVWHVKTFKGNPWGKEQQAVQWISRDSLALLEFLPSNRTILDYIIQAKLLT
ncbi:MAG: (deoxy)nucleoside triphosphate pyrophosphohydrolase [Gammaproteobacteria bacterium]|jgi:8-oxo-dGTP diphosphatase|nr:(deoxy)nucleoside triphosphate pyrophosphohydrolase [Gammaproteobacteria bacterium]